jgi:DNA-binding Xre family transcriptional regulator
MKKINKKVPHKPMNCTPFGNHLFRYAEYKNITLKALAKGIGLTLPTLKRFMTEGGRYPKLDTYLAICEVLSDSREEYNMLIMRGLRSMHENMYAERRLRTKEKQTKNDNQ